MEEMLWGNTRISVTIPSRFCDGTVIPEPKRQAAIAQVRARFTELFFGAQGFKNEVVGSYRHDDGRMVEEFNSVVYAGVMDSILDDASKRKEVVNLAAELCRDLDQESVAFCWGNELRGVRLSSGNKKPQTIPFKHLTPQNQWRFVSLVLHQVQDPAGIVHLFGLDAWEISLKGQPVKAFPELLKVCQKGKGTVRSVFALNRALRPADRKALGSLLQENDFLFSTEAGRIAVWMKVGDGLRGGRALKPMGNDGEAMPASSIRMAMAILGGQGADSLLDILDQQGLTNAFFKEYRRLFDLVTSELADRGMDPGQAGRQAQLLLGRIMFVRFLEEREWIGGDRRFLATSFRKCGTQFYRKALGPLFDDLDKPPDARGRRSGIPFLNGGLFRQGEGLSVELPDALFDPDRHGSILHAFYRFDFTTEEVTEEGASRIAVDPDMFGLVLESICTAEQRKSKGVHYTPPSISRILATQGILRRVAVLADLKYEALSRFLNGALSELTDEQAEQVKDCLPRLRILDPAVGSGSLLLASLTVMMDLATQCHARLELRLERGGVAWSKLLRRFVQSCLFGVDIDPEAVEVAKLRLWLAIAVGDNRPDALPDLRLNIRVGDSLSAVPDPFEAHEFGIEFDQQTKAWNKLVDALGHARKAKAAEARDKNDLLEKAEREYVAARLAASDDPADRRRAEHIRSGAAVPFSWRVHFADVFKEPNGGFDVVIANPPYVCIQNMDEHVDVKALFGGLAKGNADFYLLFINQALRLAGRSGVISFIMPNFSRIKSAAGLREILAKRGAVDLWVDFGDRQVFRGAKNFVSILVATAKKNRRGWFECRAVIDECWPIDEVDAWVSSVPCTKIPYASTDSLWHTASSADQHFLRGLNGLTTPLGTLADFGVGVQTSADDIYIFSEYSQSDDKTVVAHSEHLGEEVKLELAATKLLAKGAMHLVPYGIKQCARILWPHDSDGLPVLNKEWSNRYPLAWKYLKNCEDALRSRQNKAFDGPKWWRFGRDQGLKGTKCWEPGKILVPSIMRPAAAHWDRDGIAITASGKGGGGAWVVKIKPGCDLAYPWLLAVLNSAVIWRWLQVEADPKLGGWRGVDKTVLEQIPVVLPKASDNECVSGLVNRIVRLQVTDPSRGGLISQADEVISSAYARVCEKGKKQLK